MTVIFYILVKTHPLFITRHDTSQKFFVFAVLTKYSDYMICSGTFVQLMWQSFSSSFLQVANNLKCLLYRFRIIDSLLIVFDWDCSLMKFIVEFFLMYQSLLVVIVSHHFSIVKPIFTCCS